MEQSGRVESQGRERREGGKVGGGGGGDGTGNELPPL
jgi:hypothetical protein